MQGRAVAVYVAIFLLVGAAAGGLIVTADSPAITFDDPDFELSEGDTFEIDGQEYTVTDITEEEVEDHGEVHTEIHATIEWTEITEQSETWANESIVEVDDREWSVVIEGEEPTEFTLREEIDRQAILEGDPNADNETVEREDGEYVIVRDEDGEERLVPAEEYFPAPEERTYATGDTLAYEDATVTVGAITPDGVTVEWEGPETMTREIDQESRITLSGTTFIAYISDGGTTLTLSSDIEAYEQQVEQIEEFDHRTDGLFRVTVLSLLSAVFAVGAAFIPTRY